MGAFAVATGARPLPVIPIMLGEDGPYLFTPRKLVLVAYDTRRATLMLLQGQDTRDYTTFRQDLWLQRGFGEKQWAQIEARRSDPDDPVGQEHIDLMYESLVRASVQLLKGNL